jgi:hypothetical protein
MAESDDIFRTAVLELKLFQSDEQNGIIKNKTQGLKVNTSTLRVDFPTTQKAQYHLGVCYC